MYGFSLLSANVVTTAGRNIGSPISRHNDCWDLLRWECRFCSISNRSFDYWSYRRKTCLFFGASGVLAGVVARVALTSRRYRNCVGVIQVNQLIHNQARRQGMRDQEHGAAWQRSGRQWGAGKPGSAQQAGQHQAAFALLRKAIGAPRQQHEGNEGRRRSRVTGG